MRLSVIMKLRRAIERASESLPDEVATDVPELFQNWESETVYSVGDRRQYNGILWKCIQAHTSQDDWTPDVAVSLWTRTSVDEWPEWIQPTGASDSYQLDDKVSHNEKHWVSLYDNNVWEPGVFGWQEQ